MRWNASVTADRIQSVLDAGRRQFGQLRTPTHQTNAFSHNQRRLSLVVVDVLLF